MIYFPPAERVALGDVKLALYKAGPAPSETDKPLVILLHGWPELAYSWRAQIQALAAAGYPVVAPDNRGFGASDKPVDVTAYSGRELAKDCAAIVRHMGRDKAVFVGHDWGALLLWMLPFYQPNILLGCVGLNVPLMGRPPVDPLQLYKQAYGDNMYMLQFQQQGYAEQIMEADLARAFRFFFRRPSTSSSKTAIDRVPMDKKLALIDYLQMDESSWGGTPLMSDDHLQVYVDGYKDGMTAPLHWYRNIRENWQDMGQFADAAGKYPYVDLPCLQIMAELDRACPPELASGMEHRCGPLEIHTLPGCGHWTMQERPDDLNRLLLSWLARTFQALNP